MLTIKSLNDTNINDVIDAFERAFADYAVSFSRNQIATMLTRRGFDPSVSIGAFLNDQLIGFSLTAIDELNGLIMGYDVATGVVKAHRGKGISQQIFDAAVLLLKQAGAKQYMLEVMSNNIPAINLYEKCGFIPNREFVCHNSPINNLRLKDSSTSDINISECDVSVADKFHDILEFIPSWQNNIQSIQRGRDNLTAISANHGSQTVGYIIGDLSQGDVTQIAVLPQFRRKGVGTKLLKNFIDRNRCESVKVLNIESTNTSLPLFLNSCNVPEASRQLEMSLNL